MLNSLPRPGLSSAATARLLLLFLLLLPAAAGAAVPDAGVQALQDEVQQLRDRVERLEQQLSLVLQQAVPAVTPAEPAPAKAERATPVRAAAVIGSGPDELNVAIGGRIKADAIFNSDTVGRGSGDSRADFSLFPAAIPLDGQGRKDQIGYSARESRLWATATLPTRHGLLGGYVELDFFSTESSGNERTTNGYVPRLRHAYGTWAGFTAGQTSSTFMNVSAYPELNEANGPAGIINVRQALLRYEREIGRGRWFLALENPESTLTTFAGGSVAPNDDRYPDIIGKVEFSGTWGNWSLAAMARHIRGDGPAGPADARIAIADGAWGGAVSASGRIRVFERDDIRFALSYGNVLGRYLSFNAFDDGGVDAAGEIELTPAAGGFIAWQHWWHSTLRSTLAFGYAQADHDLSVVPDSVNEKLLSAHANLLWSPIPRATIGIEWVHGRRWLEDGRHGDLHRILLTSVYRF
jgi:hypothetical protein